jgi:hypothetical protein
MSTELFKEIRFIPQFSCFSYENNGFFCENCRSYYSDVNYRLPYVNIPAIPFSKSSLNAHINSNSHFLASKNYEIPNFMKKRKPRTKGIDDRIFNSVSKYFVQPKVKKKEFDFVYVSPSTKLCCKPGQLSVKNCEHLLNDDDNNNNINDNNNNNINDDNNNNNNNNNINININNNNNNININNNNINNNNININNNNINNNKININININNSGENLSTVYKHKNMDTSNIFLFDNYREPFDNYNIDTISNNEEEPTAAVSDFLLPADYKNEIHNDDEDNIIEINSKRKEEISDSSLFGDNEEDFIENQHLLQGIIDKVEVVYCMIQSNIPSKTFNSIQELIDKVSNNSFLKKLKHNSHYSYSQFLESFYNTEKIILTETVQYFKLYSIILDDSVNSSGINQTSVYCRHLNKSGQITNSFLSIRDIGRTGATSIHLFSIISEIIEDFQLKFENLVSITTDNARNMRGGPNSLASLLQRKNPLILDIPCMAHLLNLIVKDTFNKYPDLQDTMETCFEISNFINSSSNRLEEFFFIQNGLGQKKKKLLQSTEVRWLSKFNCINSVYENMLTLYKMAEVKKICVGKTASRLFTSLYDYEFIRNLAILRIILAELNDLMVKLQKVHLDIGTAFSYFNELSRYLLTQDVFNKIIEKFEFLYELKTQHTKKKLSKTLIGKELKNVNTEVENLTKNLINTILENIKIRLKQHEIISKITYLFNPCVLIEFGNDQNKWNQMKTIYVDLVNYYRSKFEEKRYSEKETDFQIFQEKIIPHLSHLHNCGEVCKFIIEKHFFFPAVTLIKIAHISLLLSPTSVVVEDGFSLCNVIHSSTRNRMSTKMINFILMSKINIDDTTTDQFFKKTAIYWLKKMKKIRKLGEIEDLINLRKIYWRRETNDEENIVEEEEKVLTSIEMVRQEEFFI